jgi:hypothetical protein
MATLAKALAFLLLTLAALPPAPAAAQEDPSGISYVTPFPEGDTYTLQAYGDQFAEGILAGLTESFAGDNRVQLSRRHRALAGLSRIEFDDDVRAEEASRDRVHIGVVMIGVNDRINIRAPGRDRLVLGSPEWREEYGRRVDRFIKMLKRRGVAVYWVGQPIMRRFEANDPAQMMNDIVRDKAYLNGIKFIDIQAHFADDAGNYTPYGPDITGKQRLLREADGVLFTPAGNRKLAHFVEQEIKRDLSQAKSERAIPLAGNEAEQSRVAALRPRPPGSPDPAAKEQAAPAAKDAKTGQAKAAAPADSGSEQKADNGRITIKSIGPGGREESVTLDILRPAIPAAVISLITRKEAGDRPSQMGDVVADEVGGGVVVLSSITPAAPSSGAARSRLAPSLSPYYQVLIKGDPVPPKPGRADDFTWPKVEYQLAPEPPARPPRSSAPKQPPRS